MVGLRSRLDSAADMHGRWSSDVYSRYIFDTEATEKRGDSMKRAHRQVIQVVNSASASMVTISAISPMSSATTNSSSTFLTSHLLRGVVTTNEQALGQ
jgi:hypothetical protein